MSPNTGTNQCDVLVYDKVIDRWGTKEFGKKKKKLVICRNFDEMLKSAQKVWGRLFSPNENLELHLGVWPTQAQALSHDY